MSNSGRYEDPFIRTHDEARDALKYASPGAIVNISAVWPPDNASRKFEVRLPCNKDETISYFDTYSLPCKAEALIKRVRDLCKIGSSQLKTPHVTENR